MPRPQARGAESYPVTDEARVASDPYDDLLKDLLGKVRSGTCPEGTLEAIAASAGRKAFFWTMLEREARTALARLPLGGNPQWIYFAQGENGGPIKIGRTHYHPETRLRWLGGERKQKMRLLGMIPGLPQLETAIHKKFAALRQEGEWFRVAPELIEYIATETMDANSRR